MAMKKLFRLTTEGVDELKVELGALIAARLEIAERVKTAREFGDLAENAEYSSARQEQDKNEARIAEVENILQNVELIKKPHGVRHIQLGSTVKLKGLAGGSKEFQIVGTVEADPLNGKISDESPIGRALMGKTPGDKVEIKVASETATYKITDIS
jgi:transcription elongation factor GreA